MIDIVYIVKMNRSNLKELKYSLRSIDINLPHNKVYLIGDKPDWIQNVIHIPHKEISKNKFYNINFKIYRASLKKEISDDFVVFWDDIFILNKLEKIDYFSSGELIKDVIKKRLNHNYHWFALKNVGDIFPDGIDCDVHHPYIFNKTKIKDLIYKYKLNDDFLINTLYCNEYEIKGEIVKDNKARSINDLERIKQEKPDIFSSTDNLAKQKYFDVVMNEFFSVKSKYEK